MYLIEKLKEVLISVSTYNRYCPCFKFYSDPNARQHGHSFSDRRGPSDRRPCYLSHRR